MFETSCEYGSIVGKVQVCHTVSSTYFSSYHRTTPAQSHLHFTQYPKPITSSTLLQKNWRPYAVNLRAYEQVTFSQLTKSIFMNEAWENIIVDQSHFRRALYCEDRLLGSATRQRLWGSSPFFTILNSSSFLNLNYIQADSWRKE